MKHNIVNKELEYYQIPDPSFDNKREIGLDVNIFSFVQ